MSESAMTSSLPALFARALESASKAFNLPAIDDEAQSFARTSLNDLTTLTKRVAALSLFSPNESLEDIATRDLLYLLVPFVVSEVRGRVIAPERDERMLSLTYCQDQLRHFLSTLENYDIVPRTERELYQTSPPSISNAAARRELKIKQYQKEKSLRTRIQEVRRRRRQAPTEDGTNDLDLVLSLVSSSTHTSDEDDENDDENLREATLLLLRLTYAQACSQLQIMDQEMQLLRSMPPDHHPREAADDRTQYKDETDNIWKLDSPVANISGPLLDPQGRPRRPFTILPTREAANRARLQAQVFGPGHTLPTMSIDEYLEIERQRGNIISGGGSQSATQPSSSEQLALDAEMDGTALGDEKSEEKRSKDENWARFTDENLRGQGNTMNRG